MERKPRRGGSSREEKAGRKENKEQNKFTPKMQKKLVVLYFLVLLAFAGLSARLVTITRDDGQKYKKEVLSQQRYESKTIPYKRGEILDSKGTKLAVSEKVYNLILDCKLMLDKEDYLEPTVAALVQYFGISETEIRAYAKDNPTSRYRVLAKQLTYEQISPFIEVQDNEETGKNIQGIWFEEEYKRVYPNNTMASQVIGFTNKDQEGNYGLEEYYNNVLSGTNGREYGYLNDDSNLERTTKAAVDGYNVVSTIDANIQSIVERNLVNFNEENKNKYREGNGARNIGCVIMDVHSGNVLAMASYPFFDLNDTKNPAVLLGTTKLDEKNMYVELQDENGAFIDQTISQADLDQMSDEEIMRNLNNVWKNFCIANTYEPGSTIKPFTAAAGLESGKLIGNEVYQCDGSLVVADGQKPIKCHNYLGDGPVSISKSIEMSCNVGLMKMGQQMGKDVLLKYLQEFNFGLKTNVDLAGEARTASLVFNDQTMGPTELATSSFGQGFNVTMIQMITGFSALVNGGYYYEPHMASKVTASDGSVVQNLEPRVLKQIISEDTSAHIREYCKQVVIGEKGTGRTARPAGYIIGGKTGTAETTPRGNRQYVVSFIGYAPADNPEIAIYVVVDRPNVKRQDDAKFATYVVKDILEEVLPYMGIYMTESLTDKEREDLEAKQIAYKEALKSQVSGNDVSGNSVSGNGAGGDVLTGEDGGLSAGDPVSGNEADTGKPGSTEREIKIDPETGYAIAPDGTLVDPVTGYPIDAVSNLPE